MPRRSAHSRTVLVMMPIWSTLDPNATRPLRLMRPYVGLSPTTPQSAAGWRTEPPVSEPRAAGTMRAATATAEPPDEPPGTRVGSHGLRAGPNAECSVDEPIANSSRFVLPTTLHPPARSRATAVASKGDRNLLRIRDAHVVGMSVVTMLSFTATGIPSPASRATCRNALSFGLRRSIAASDAATSSVSLAASRASCHGRCRRSVTDHLRDDEVAVVAERRPVRRNGIAIDGRTRHIVAQRRRIRGRGPFESGDVDFAQLVDVRKDLRHLAGHAFERGIVELQVRQFGDALRFVA